MKTFTRFSLVLTAASALVLSSFGVSAVASEKGAELLAKRTTMPVAIPAATPAPMNCANCTDAWVTVVDKGTKGPLHAVNKIVRHGCASCDTRIVTKGSGKTAANMAVHTCGAASAMCATR